MKDFRQLKVWEKAHLLALAVYPFGEISPRRNLWTHGSDSAGRLLDSSNIAEGCGRDGDAELARFCVIARGSATELEYQLLLARDLKLLQPDDYEQLSQQTIEIKTHAHRLGSEADRRKLNADRTRPADPSTLVAATGRARRFKRGTASMAAPFRARSPRAKRRAGSKR